MKIFKLDLLTLLISLFILGACNNPDEIGLDVDPSNSLNTAIHDESIVKAFTVPEDKMATNGLSKYPIGYFVDPAMGLTVANVGATLNLVEAAKSFGTNILLDSAVLVLDYADSFYGDSLESDYRFTVHQLTDKISPTVHYNTTPIAFNAAEIGSRMVSKIKMNDSVKVKQIVKGSADTEITQAPQIRIPIDANFINDNFFNASADKFETNSKFIDHIKGIYLKVDPMNAPDAGGIPFFDFSSGSSKLELYYRNNNGATIDTNYVIFTINNGTSPVVAHFTHDYSGTEVAYQLANPTEERDQVFVQALAGLRTKITFPDLNDLKLLGNIVINKAELVISIDGGTDEPFAPAPRLGLYQTDIASQRQPLADIDPYDARSLGLEGFGGVYNKDKKTYTFTITAYIQDLLLGKTKPYPVYLAPLPLGLNSVTEVINPSAIVATRSILGSGKNTNFKMKLKVKYALTNN